MHVLQACNPTNNVSALFDLITKTVPFLGYSTAPPAFAVTLSNRYSSCPAEKNLGTLTQFELLAGSTITATPAFIVTTVTGGDIRLSPGSAVTGFPPAVLPLLAVDHFTDAAAAQAQLDLTVF